MRAAAHGAHVEVGALFDLGDANALAVRQIEVAIPVVRVVCIPAVAGLSLVLRRIAGAFVAACGVRSLTV